MTDQQIRKYTEARIEIQNESQMWQEDHELLTSHMILDREQKFSEYSDMYCDSSYDFNVSYVDSENILHLKYVAIFDIEPIF